MMVPNFKTSYIVCFDINLKLVLWLHKMERNELRSLNWKKRIQESFSHNLLNFSQQNGAPHSLNSSNIKEQRDACHDILNIKPRNIGNIKFLSGREKSDCEQNNAVGKSVHVDSVLQTFTDSLQIQSNGLNDSENPVGKNETIRNIIIADADKLAKKLNVKQNKKYSHPPGSNRESPNWSMSIKKALDPNSVPESSLKALEMLSKDDCQPLEDLKKLSSQSLSKSCSKKHYTSEEKKILNILKSARTFKPLKKTNLNSFDGSGVNCFKNSKNEFSIQKTKNVPPGGGYVCIKPLTVEDVMKRPPNLIVDECWDYYDNEW